MRAPLVVDALQMALATRERVEHVELIHHSDRGSQYTSSDLAAVLAEHDVLASVGSTGDAYDNAMAESFVDTFKTELIADRLWRTKTQLELAIVKWVGWYNHDRLHGELADIPPIEFEAAWRVSKTVNPAGLEDPISGDHHDSSLCGLSAIPAPSGITTTINQPN